MFPGEWAGQLPAVLTELTNHIVPKQLTNRIVVKQSNNHIASQYRHVLPCGTNPAVASSPLVQTLSRSLKRSPVSTRNRLLLHLPCTRLKWYTRSQSRPPLPAGTNSFRISQTLRPCQSVALGKFVQTRVRKRSPLSRTTALGEKLNFGDPFLDSGVWRGTRFGA